MINQKEKRVGIRGHSPVKSSDTRVWTKCLEPEREASFSQMLHTQIEQNRTFWYVFFCAFVALSSLTILNVAF